MYHQTVKVPKMLKTSVCGRSLAGIASSNPAEGHGCKSVVTVVCC